MPERQVRTVARPTRWSGELYVRMLLGEISPKEYAETLKREVRRRRIPLWRGRVRLHLTDAEAKRLREILDQEES